MTRNTVLRWKNREEGQDASSRPKELHTGFEDWQEELIVELRKDLLLPLDDLLVLVRELIRADCSRSGLSRLLRRNNVGNLNSLIPKEENSENSKGKGKFPEYPVGYIHVDIKYLPKIPDKDHQSYLFVAIDRATRWVFAHIYDEKSAANTEDFATKLRQAF